MNVDILFDFGDTVCLKHDKDQLPRMVTSIELFAAGEVMYKLRCGAQLTGHYDYEISPTKNYQME